MEKNNMAKADTYAMEEGRGYRLRPMCYIEGCPGVPVARGFYYPTVMNGDAQWLGDYCKEHKGVDLKRVKSSLD
jgi:hypothetical protein